MWVKYRQVIESDNSSTGGRLQSRKLGLGNVVYSLSRERVAMLMAIEKEVKLKHLSDIPEVVEMSKKSV